jgi:transcriptional regulator with XRE-family HTH domain
MKKNNIRKVIRDNPSYWVEKTNIALYDAIVRFMQKKKMNQKSLAKYLEISEGRLSQILNTGNINYSLEKIIQIAIKVEMYPAFNFISKSNLEEAESKHLFAKQSNFDYDGQNFYPFFVMYENTLNQSVELENNKLVNFELNLDESRN